MARRSFLRAKIIQYLNLQLSFLQIQRDVRGDMYYIRIVTLEISQPLPSCLLQKVDCVPGVLSLRHLFKFNNQNNKFKNNLSSTTSQLSKYKNDLSVSLSKRRFFQHGSVTQKLIELILWAFASQCSYKEEKYVKKILCFAICVEDHILTQTTVTASAI